MNFEILKSVIQSRGFTYRQLSKQCGLNERYIESMIQQKFDPSADIAYSIAKALGTTVEYLVAGDDPDDKPALPGDLQDIINKYSTK